MSGLISIISMIVGAAGIFFGFYFIPTEPLLALRIVVLSTVGIVGVLSFVRHVVFYKSDMKRLGWVTENPDWMFEVGFANLAFGLYCIFRGFWEKPTYSCSCWICNLSFSSRNASWLQVFYR